MFKDKLKKLRKQRKLTQEALAEKLYVSRDLVTKWENGKRYPSPDITKKISEIPGVSEAYLLEDDREAINCLEELDECVSESAADSNEEEIRQLTLLVADFLKQQSPENRKLFIRRYYYDDSPAEISRKTGLTPDEITATLSELRQKLTYYLGRHCPTKEDNKNDKI